MAKKKKKNVLKAAIYIRVSTVEQSDNDFSSLDGQENQCRTWIDQKNQIISATSPKIEVYKIYKDTKSGKDLNRPGIELLMKDAKAGKFDLIIVTKIDRVSRSLKDFLNFFENLEEYEIDIAAVTQEIDTSTAAGKALQRMLLVFAEFEREMVGERTREKRIETVKAGRYAGGTPVLGYDNIDKKLIVNETEAKLIKEVYNRYLKIKSSRDVARSLNKDGYHTKKYTTKNGVVKGGNKFTNRTILKILNSRLYLGQFEFEGTIYEGLHTAIIDEGLYKKAQEILALNTVKTHPNIHLKSTTPAILKNLCSCGFCSSSLTVAGTTKRNKAGNKYYYYKCTQKNNRGVTLEHNPKDLPVARLDNFVVETLKLMLKEPELMQAMKERIKFEGEDRVKEISEKITRLQNLLKSKKKDKTNTLKLVTDNANSTFKDTYESQLESIILEIEQMENEIEFLKEQKQSLKLKSPIASSTYKQLLQEFVDRFDNGSLKMKRELTNILVKNVESSVNSKTNDGTITVQYIADKGLEVDWKDTKNANSLSKVRRFATSGSPGRI